MRIALLIYADFPEGSGPPRRIMMMGKGLVAQGHEVHVIVPQRFRPGALAEEIHGMSVHWGVVTDTTRWSGLTARLAARRSAFRILNEIGETGLDWLLLSNPGLDGIIYAAIAKRHGARVAAMYDDLRSEPEKPTLQDRVRLPWLRTADALIPRMTDLNVTISHFLERIIKRHAPTTPTFILPPIVDTNMFREQPDAAGAFRERLALGNVPLVSYLGTYWNVEGLSVLVEAASILAREGVVFRLAISGAAHVGLDCDDVTALIDRFGVRSQVIETGWLTTDEVMAAMSAADVLVISKLDDVANRAGMPTKLSEYLSIGRAISVSRVGEIPMYVTDRHDVLLVEPGSATALAAALRELLGDASLRARLGANARRTAIERFDCVTVVGELSAAMTALSN